MTNPNDDPDFPGVTVDTSDPEHVSDFTTRDHFPDEIAEQWDDIRAGKLIPVDEAGNPTDDLHDAYCILHPGPGGRGGLPPVGSTPVGEPDRLRPYDTWIDPETKQVMVWNGEASIGVAEWGQDNE